MRLFIGVKLLLCVVGIAVWSSAPAYALDVSFSATASVDKVVFPQTEVVSYDVTMQNGEKPVAFQLEVEKLNPALLFAFASVKGDATIFDSSQGVSPDPRPGFCYVTENPFNRKEVNVRLAAKGTAVVRFTYDANRLAPRKGSSYGAVVAVKTDSANFHEDPVEVASVSPIPTEGQYSTALEVKSNPVLPQVDLSHGGVGRLPEIPVLKAGSSLEVYGKAASEISGQSLRLLARGRDVFGRVHESQPSDRLVAKTTVDSQGEYRFPPLILGKSDMSQLYVSYGGDGVYAPHQTCPLALYVPIPKPVDRKLVEAKIFGNSRWLHLRWKYDTAKESLDRSFLTFKVFAYERYRTSAGRSALRKVFLKQVEASQMDTGQTFRELIRLSQKLRKQIESVAIAVVYSPLQQSKSFRISTQPIKVKHQRL